MPFVPLAETEKQDQPRKGFTPIEQVDAAAPPPQQQPAPAPEQHAAPPRGFTPIEAVQQPEPAPAAPGIERTPLYIAGPDTPQLGQLPPEQPQPGVQPEQPAPQDSLLPDWMSSMLGQVDPMGTQQKVDELLNPPDPTRLPDAVLSDLSQGKPGVTSEEFSSILQQLEAGQLQNPEDARALLTPFLSDQGRQAVDEAIKVRQFINDRANAPDTGVMPVGEGTQTFLEGLVKGATFNEIDPATGRVPGLHNPWGDTELGRIAQRASEIEAQNRRAENPVQAFTGEAAGSILPFAQGVKMLRAYRLARGLPAVEASTGGYIAEGAKVGGPQAFAYRPEGSDNMTVGQELAARTTQATVGTTAGAVLDFGALKLGDFAGHVFGKLKDKKLQRDLLNEARQNGFDNTDEYLSSLVDFIDTPDGVVVRPKQQTASDLPDEQTADTTPREPAPEGANAEAGGGNQAAPAGIDFPTENQLRSQAYREKARQHGLTDEQAAAFEPEPNIDDLTGFQGRRDRIPTVERAIKKVEEGDTPGQYVAMDIINLGGLNARFGEPGADKVFRELSGIIQDEFDKAGGSVNLFRHGGDEVSAVTLGIPDEELSQVLARVKQRADQYQQELGLADIPHTKEGKGPGTGINYGVAPIEKGGKASDILDIAHARLEKAKVEKDVNTIVSQETQPGRPDQQAAGAEQVYPGAGGQGRDVGAGRGAPQEKSKPGTLGQQASEYERLASQAQNPTIKADLQRQADLLRSKIRDEQPKKNAKQRAREARRINTEQDDIITAIRKLGGLDVAEETDWAGRLSHLPRKGFGLPGIEQAKGGGRTLDDLAEVLHEYGYLQSRDVRELEDKLGTAELGTDVWSLDKQNFDAEAAPAGSSDRDWTFQQVDNLDEVDADFVIDLESGTAVPARPITEEDLYRLIQEEDNARAWYQREAASASHEGAAGAVRLHERGAGETQGVRGYKSRTEEGPPPVDDDGGFSVETPRGKKPYTPKSGKKSDSVIFDRGGPLSPDEALNIVGRRIKHVETGSLPSGLRRIESSEDMAHVIAPIRRDAQESFFTAITDQDGNILRVAKLHRGSNLTTTVDPTLIAGVASNTPGAKRVWLAHNHPSGKLKQSEADHDLAQEVADLLRGTDIDMEGSVVVGPGGRVVTDFNPDTSVETSVPTRAARRTEQIPVSERRITGSDKDVKPIESLEDAAAALKQYGGDREGVLMLDANNKPVGFLPMTKDEMRELRTGETGGSRKLYKAMDETNADAFIVRTDSESAAGNMNAFAEQTGKRLLDVINKKGESLVEKRGGISSQSTFYSNPFLLAAGEVAKDIGLHPGRNLAAGFAGGVGGATLSEHEVGSPEWWVDVAYGAIGTATVFQVARGTRLLGQGSLIDNSISHIGRYIDNLPLVGRGSVELRELKRKQRLMKDILDRQTEETGKHLLNKFTPAERAMMSDIIESRGIIKDLNLIHRQAQALDEHITFAAERMKELGMLPPDLEAGGYLHRYYAKHLGFDKLFRQARKQSLSGSYTIARGTDDVFNKNYLSPGARATLDELDQVIADINRLERRKNPDQQQIDHLKARRKELRSQELHEYIGMENGQPKSFIFAKDEVPAVTGRNGYNKAQYDSGLDNPPNIDLNNLTKSDRVWTPRGSQGDRALLHRDWTKAERQSWGEIDDAGYRYVRGMAEVSHDLSMATLFNKLSKNSEWVSDTPRTTRKGKEWVQVPDSKVHKNSPLKKYGDLAGMYVRPDVWNGIRNYGRGLFGESRSAKIYRNLLSKWKLYKTVYNPVTHLNNTYSNIEMLYQGGYSPASLAQAIKHMNQGEQSAIWREARDNGLFGADWSTSLLNTTEGGGSKALGSLAEELRSQPDIPDAEQSIDTIMRLKDWWINSRNAVRDADSPFKTGKAIVDAMGRPTVKGLKFAARPVRWATDSAQRLYKFEDELFKMAVYQAERKAGSSPTEAVNAAQRLFFDYNDIPEAVKIVRDFPIGSPFISYTYLAIPAIARNFARNPEKMLALVAAYEAWNYGALVSQGMGPGEYWTVHNAEEEIAPPWERGRSLWGALNTIHMPAMESYRLSLGRAHALGNPFMSEAGGREKLPAAPYAANFWGSSIFGSNPTHALLDILVNEDWKGKEIYKKGAPAEEKAKKIATYLYQAWSPSNPAFPGSYHQVKVIEGLANDVRKAREEGKDPGFAAPIVDNANAIAEYLGMEGFTGLNRADNEIKTRDALLGSVGVKLRPIRFDQSQDFEYSGIDKDKKEVAEWYRSMVRLHSEGRITDKQMDQADKQFDQALENLDTNMDTIDEAGDKVLNK